MTDVATNTIRIRGARTHNLRGVDLDLPVGKLIVITGVSGCGKSSLAFDTIFAEGQRRYLESVSVHTRTLLKQLPRPDVDEVEGLPPTISVDQRVTSAPARSTLAVTTEIYDYLRLMYARAGTAHCTDCGNPVESQSVDQILESVLRKPERTKLMVLAPLVRSRKGAHKDVLERIGRSGFVRVRVDSELLDISDVPDLSPQKSHTIEAIIDRIILKDGVRQRLRESIELAVRESEGTCILCEQIDGDWRDTFYSTKFSCADCNLSFPTPEPRTFSFNSAWGACPTCEGFGVKGIAEDVDEVTVFRKTACEDCEGSRLQPFARRVTFGGRPIGDVTALSVNDALQLVGEWRSDVVLNELTQDQRLVAERTLPDICSRLECLAQVGVGYLELNRATRTLSGGEYQRARLAACLGTGLHGACFVLDEPTSGLHPRDTQQLLQTLFAIRDNGVTVIVVEHDGEVMNAADHIVDLGPGAGIEGGQLQFSGTVDDLRQTASTLTAEYLRGELQDAEDGKRGDGEEPSHWLKIAAAAQNNLQQIDVEIPLGRLVCVSGVSGSGKTSLVMETLLPVAESYLDDPASLKTALADVECKRIDGLESVQRIVAVDNSPLGRNRRSCIATYSGLWNEVRKIFTKTRGARAKGFKAARFSFNSGDGRCQACKGTGVQDVRMAFLPDATVPCPDCNGKRFNRATLAIRFADRNVDDVLKMRVDEAIDFFAEMEKVRALLETYQSVGLGYLTLGQPASTFSGGESQRIKLAKELSSRSNELTLFILDEPTSGLHPADVMQLVQLLRRLVSQGHSVVVIEHNCDVIRASDWVIDIGPGSGAEGGRLVAAGTPAQISAVAESYTGAALVR